MTYPGQEPRSACIIRRVLAWCDWYLDPVLLMMIGFTLIVIAFVVLTALYS